MNKIADSKRPSLAKAALLIPLSGAALITNTAAAATETFHLLGQLGLAGFKYGAIGSVRVLTQSNTYESLYNKLPNGQSLTQTAAKIGKLIIAIFYSLIGLVAPMYNLRCQEELGNFVKKRPQAPPLAAPEAMPQLPHEQEPLKIPTHLLPSPEQEHKKELPPGCRKKKIRKNLRANRHVLRKIQKAKFLGAVKHAKEAMDPSPKKRVRFAPDALLVEVRPIPNRKMEKEAQGQQTPFPDPQQKTETNRSFVANQAPRLGALAGVGAAILSKTRALSDSANLFSTGMTKILSTAYPSNILSSSVRPLIHETTFAETAGSMIRKAVAPTLLSCLANRTAPATSGPAAPALLSNVAHHALALAGPISQIAQASLPAAIVNGTCSLAAASIHALAAPALTVAQIVKGAAPLPAAIKQAAPSLLSSVAHHAAALAGPVSQISQASLPAAIVNGTSSLAAASIHALAAPALTVAQIVKGAAPFPAAIEQAAPSLLSSVAHHAAALAGPVSQIAQASLPAVIVNGTCSLAAASIHALAAPALTVAQIIKGAAPLPAAIEQAAPTFLSSLAHHATALVGPVSHIMPASLSAAAANGTCSLAAASIHALAAPGLTVAQIVHGTAPMVATELAKHVSMSWTSIAIVVGGLAVRVLPVLAGAVSGG